MRKLTLDPEALRVESFRTDDPAPPAEGTVKGHALDTGLYSCLRTCFCPSHHNTECCGAM